MKNLNHFNSHAATSTSMSQTHSDNEDTDEVTLEQ